MKIAIALMATLLVAGCNSQPQPQPQPQPINKEWIEAQQQINRTIIQLLESLNKDSKVRTIDFESLGLKPYTK